MGQCKSLLSLSSLFATLLPRPQTGKCGHQLTVRSKVLQQKLCMLSFIFVPAWQFLLTHHHLPDPLIIKEHALPEVYLFPSLHSPGLKTEHQLRNYLDTCITNPCPTQPFLKDKNCNQLEGLIFPIELYYQQISTCESWHTDYPKWIMDKIESLNTYNYETLNITLVWKFEPLSWELSEE